MFSSNLLKSCIFLMLTSAKIAQAVTESEISWGADLASTTAFTRDSITHERLGSIHLNSPDERFFYIVYKPDTHSQNIELYDITTRQPIFRANATGTLFIRVKLVPSGDQSVRFARFFMLSNDRPTNVETTLPHTIQ